MVDSKRPANYMGANKQNKVDLVEWDEDNPTQFKDENMYKYHENTLDFEAKAQPFSFFYVTVSGQI